MRDVPDFIGLLSDPDLLQLLLFACPDGVVATDRDHRIVLYTGASESIFGFPPYEVLHREAHILFENDDAYEKLRHRLRHDGRVVNLELSAKRKDDAPFAAAVSAAVMHDRYGGYLGAVAYVRDNSSVRRIEDHLRTTNQRLEESIAELDYVARHDALTGLLHRASAIEAAEAALLSSGLTGVGFGVVVFDLDHFKSVNDSYGHLVGDEVLAAMAKVLRDTARAGDIIGRFGGEEFIAFLPGADLDNALAFAERVRGAISEARVVVGDARIAVTISAGVAASPYCADSLHETLRVADDRLFVAKRAGRNRCLAHDELQDGKSAA